MNAAGDTKARNDTGTKRPTRAARRRTGHRLTTSAHTIREALITTYSRNTGDRESVANNFDRIAERAYDASDVDSTMVASIRDAVSRGQYRVEPESIAVKLIHMDSTLQRLRRPERA